MVSNSPELYAALTAASARDTVLARAGVYLIAQPGETVLQATPALVGDLLKLFVLHPVRGDPEFENS